MKLTNLLKKITGLPWTSSIHADPQQGHIMGRERLGRIFMPRRMFPNKPKQTWPHHPRRQCAA